MIGVDGVSEKNGGANANQKRNKERHVNVPHSGWGSLGSFPFQNRFVEAAKRFHRSSAGLGLPPKSINPFLTALTELHQSPI
jgi:hypothetical protein